MGAVGSRETPTVPAAPIPQIYDQDTLTLYEPYGAEDMALLCVSGNFWLALRSLAIPAPQSNINMDSSIEAGLAPESPPPLIFTLIRQAFSYFQMQLPSTYFHRVKVIIHESGISIADFYAIQRRGILRALIEITEAISSPVMPEIDELHTKRFKEQWEVFVQRCMKEWKNLNITSALLLR